MPENDKTDTDNQPGSQRGLWLIIAAGFVAVVVVIFVGSSWISPVDRTRFITEFILTVALADLVAVQAYIYKKQWTVMERQFMEFENQTRQNEWEFRQAQRNASAVQSQMQEQSNAMKGQLEAMKAQIAVAEHQANLADAAGYVAVRGAKAAEDGVRVAQENTVYAQRAYVSVPSGDVIEDVFYLRVENFGNTPANNVEICAVAEIAEQPPTIDLDSAIWTQAGLIAPHTHIKRMVAPKEARIPNILQGGEKFYCVGVIRYRDIFGKTRHTKFCFYYRIGTQFGPCKDGNEAD